MFHDSMSIGRDVCRQVEVGIMERIYSYRMKYMGEDYDTDYAEWLETPDGTTPFYVHNLQELCDGIVGRELFSASDYLDAVNDGIRLGQAGYTSAEISDVEKVD